MGRADCAAMVVAVIVRNEHKAPQMVHWAAQFARARSADLLVLHPIQRDQGEVVDVRLRSRTYGKDVAPIIAAVRTAVEQLTDLAVDAEEDHQHRCHHHRHRVHGVGGGDP